MHVRNKEGRTRAPSSLHMGLALKGKLSTSGHDLSFSKRLNGTWTPWPASGDTYEACECESFSCIAGNTDLPSSNGVCETLHA